MKSNSGKRVIRPQESQKLRFLIVGAINTVFGYSFFAVLLRAFGETQYVIAVAVSTIVATSLSFALNRLYVFGSRGQLFFDYLRFQITYSVVLLVNLALLLVLVELVDWPVLLSQAVCLCFVAVSSYLGHKYFSFRHKIGGHWNEQIDSAQ